MLEKTRKQTCAESSVIAEEEGPFAKLVFIKAGILIGD